MSTHTPTDEQAPQLWWRCCWGHLFPHPPVTDEEGLTCPLPEGRGGQACGTAFVFEPFASFEEAQQAVMDGVQMRWAAWADPRP